MKLLLKMTITSSAGMGYDPLIAAVDIEKLINWPPGMRIPVKDDVISLDEVGVVFNRAVEEVWLYPLGSGPFATVYLENFVDPDPGESAIIDFPNWART